MHGRRPLGGGRGRGVRCRSLGPGGRAAGAGLGTRARGPARARVDGVLCAAAHTRQGGGAKGGCGWGPGGGRRRGGGSGRRRSVREEVDAGDTPPGFATALLRRAASPPTPLDVGIHRPRGLPLRVPLQASTQRGRSGRPACGDAGQPLAPDGGGYQRLPAARTPPHAPRIPHHFPVSATSRPKGMRPGPWSAARSRRLPPAARRLRGIRARPPPCECVVYRAGVTGWAGCFGGQGFWVATVRDSTHATNPNSRPPQALARSSVAGTVLAGACLRFRAGGWGGSGMASRRLSPLPPPPRVPRPPSL